MLFLTNTLLHYMKITWEITGSIYLVHAWGGMKALVCCIKFHIMLADDTAPTSSMPVMELFHCSLAPLFPSHVLEPVGRQ